MILFFLHKYFSDPDGLVKPINPLGLKTDRAALEAIFDGGDFKNDLRILNSRIRAHGDTIPPLVHAYMSLSPTMKIFGTAINDEFGDVEETGIFLAVNEILEEKKQRHIDTYQP